MTPNLFGFELETVSPLRKPALSIALNQSGIKTEVSEDLNPRDRSNYVFNGIYSLADDGSINPLPPNFGVEIRSFVARIDELDRFRSLFDTLRDLGVKVNRRCGLHIHASNADYEISAAALRLATEKESVRVGRKRKKYSVWKGENNAHYQAVNQRSNKHVEFRWFNAAVDFRYLCKMVRLVDKYIMQLREEAAMPCGTG